MIPVSLACAAMSRQLKIDFIFKFRLSKIEFSLNLSFATKQKGNRILKFSSWGKKRPQLYI